MPSVTSPVPPHGGDGRGAHLGERAAGLITQRLLLGRVLLLLRFLIERGREHLARDLLLVEVLRLGVVLPILVERLLLLLLDEQHRRAAERLRREDQPLDRHRVESIVRSVVDGCLSEPEPVASGTLIVLVVPPHAAARSKRKIALVQPMAMGIPRRERRCERCDVVTRTAGDGNAWC